MNTWRLITIAVDPEVQEPLSSLLFDLGATGLITLEETATRVTLGAYYRDESDPEHIIHTVQNTFNKTALQDFSSSTIPDEDWMQKWKEGFEAIEIGRRLLISPSWKTAPPPDRGNSPQPASDRIVIQVDPGMAFGTGTHETTRLCLEALERHWQGGRMLDVGTGTGILGIAAAKLYPGSRITMIDIDPDAVEIATENAAINGVSDSVEIHCGETRDQPHGAFDLVVANLTAEVIVDLRADLVRCVVPGGWLILSGILNELAGGVEEALAESRLEVVETKVNGEWTALVAQEVSNR